MESIGFGAAAIASALAVMTGAAAAQVCSSDFVVSVADAAYVVDDCTFTEFYCFSVVVYAESNGVAGLQRGGSDPLGLGSDSCGDPGVPPDTMVI